MGRTAKRILHHLPSAPPQSQLRLANLLTAILLLPQHQHPASLLTAPTLTIANAIRTLTTSTSYQTNEPSALLMLFTSFQQLFWSSLHSSSLSAPQRTATRTLLYLSCTIAFALSSSAHKQQTKHAPSLLAAAIFCSGINIVNSNQDAKNAKDEQWRNDFHLCFSAITQQQQDDIHKQHAHEKQQHQTQWGWYTYLLSNLVSTLTTSASSTDALADQVASTTAPSQTPSPLPTTANSTEVNIISKTTLEMVKGRELYLLQNALHVFQSMQTTNYSTSSSETEIQTTIFANSMIQLLTHVLQTNKELAVLASCVAKGEDIRHFFPFQKDKEDTSKAVVDLTQHPDDNEDDAEESDDEDEDMEEEEETTNPTPPSMTATGRSAAHSTTTTSASSAKTTFKIKRHQRLTRQELQTLPKLDKLYQHDWLQVRRAVLSTLYHHSQQSNNHASSVDSMQLLLTLATQIGGGNWNNSPNDLIVHLGTFAFSSSQSTTSTTQTNAKDAYITLLTTLLQSCTSLRVSNNGENKPLLTKLAFHPDLLPSLWEYVQYKSTRAKAASAGGDGLMEALTCTFCDLFVHHLLAVDDEEFILSYTNKSRSDENDDGRRKKAIMAEDVILYLRSVLHELYWTRPVTASDVIVPVSSIHAGSDNDGADAAHMTARCHRARLLLSGTKLWNALHERWCRLLRTFPFCDEQVWWFPRLVSKERDDDGVFFVGESESSTRSSYAAGMGLEPVDSNDDDEDDDDGLDEDSTSSPMDVDEDDNNNSSSTAADAESDALASSFRDPKMARILTSIPQSIPFDRRVKLFESLLNADKARTQDETAAFRRMMMNMGNMDEMENGMIGREQVTIRRDNIYADSMNNLNKLGKKMRRKVQVTFINKHGAVEAGIDGGGVFKEFLDDLITEAFNPESGHVEDGTHGPLFGVTPLQTLHVGVSPDVGAFSADNSRVLSHYEFLGRVLGKAVYESILVEPQFCLPFLNKLLGKQNTLDDLKNLDPDYYRHLSTLRKMNEEEIKDLGLSFELTIGGNDNSKSGKKILKTVELVPGGSHIPVTKQNAIRYVHLVAHRRMNVEGSRETHAFLRGFRDLIPAAWVRLFSAYELQKMISGDDTIKGIDVNGMRSVMQYSGGYHPSQPIVRWLWEVVEEMTPRQQRMFLKFMTSCSRQPLLGFHALEPVPCIQQIRLRDNHNHHQGGEGGRDVRLPTSSTCMNLLKLPKYDTKELLREKLIYAIESAAGFELS